MSILTLELAQVKIGSKEVEGLLDITTASFYIGVPQICSQFSVPPGRSIKQLEALLDIPIQSHKAKTILNPKPINVVDLTQYELIVAKLDRKGYKLAQDFRDELVGLSLTQLFSDAFGIKFEIEDRQEYLLKRQAQKEIRLKETGCVDTWMSRHDSEISPNYKKWIWVNISDAVNLALTGQKASYWRKELGLKDDCLLRDNWNIKMLSDIHNIEELASKLIDRKDIEPKQAVKQAIDVLMIEIHPDPLKA